MKVLLIAGLVLSFAFVLATSQQPSSKYPLKYVGYLYPAGPKDTHGTEVNIELFGDILCPYTKRAYSTLKELISYYRSKKINIQLRIINAVQPFHPRSYYVTSTIAAANFAAQTRTRRIRVDDTAIALSDKFFSTQESYSEKMTNDITPNNLLKQLRFVASNHTCSVGGGGTCLTEVEIEEAYKNERVDAIVKGQIKYGRQNSVHGTPTFAINGLLEPTIESSWTLEQWLKLIDPLIT
ncbi:homeobox and leucine zipper protein Homez [Acrasis kona]|uniref:Homeobox and leucine zipper protein Homez n=1 Tax=Acrasis kona TaxID=1008807 RepID=A0AAW2ZPZ0_9EUKA